jgi:hypothetical protein
MVTPETNNDIKWSRADRIIYIPWAVIRLTLFIIFRTKNTSFADWWTWVKWTVGVWSLPDEGFDFVMEGLEKIVERDKEE